MKMTKLEEVSEERVDAFIEAHYEQPSIYNGGLEWVKDEHGRITGTRETEKAKQYKKENQ